MNLQWKAPIGAETPARLYIGGVLIATIKKRPSGRLPYHFSQKIILTYNGGFKTADNAKRHAEKRLIAFASSILSRAKKNNQWTPLSK